MKLFFPSAVAIVLVSWSPSFASPVPQGLAGLPIIIQSSNGPNSSPASPSYSGPGSQSPSYSGPGSQSPIYPSNVGGTGGTGTGNMQGPVIVQSSGNSLPQPLSPPGVQPPSGQGMTCVIQPGDESATTPLFEGLNLDVPVDGLKTLLKQTLDNLGDFLASDAGDALIDRVEDLAQALLLGIPGDIDLDNFAAQLSLILDKPVKCLLDTLLPLP